MSNRTEWPTSLSVGLGMFSEERMQSLQDGDVHFMELTTSTLNDLTRSFPKMAASVVKTAADHGVTVRSFHLPFDPFSEIDPASTDAACRRRFLEEETPLLAAAAQSGIGIAVVHPSGEPYEDDTRGDNLNYAIESLSALQRVADENGIKLAVENLPRTCIGRDIRELTAILEALPAAYACFDTNHSLQDDNAAFIRALGDRLIALHVSDYDFVDERHWLPGDGKNDWSAIMTALEEVDYRGTWNCELRWDVLKTLTGKGLKDNHRALLSR